MMLDINWKPIDDRLRDIYASRKRGLLKGLAAEYQLDSRVFSERAKFLGLPPMMVRFNSMSDEESQIMVDNYPCSSYKMQRILASKGFKMVSRNKILKHYTYLKKCGRLPDKEDALLDKSVYTASMLQQLMGATRHHINHWVSNGMLKVIPRNPKEEHRSERYFNRKDVAEFMKTFPSHWNSKRCDHYWMVDILTNDNTRFTTFRQESAGIDENSVPC